MPHTLLTGASSGIGRSLARRLAGGGDALSLLARRADLLDSLVAEIEDAGGRALAIPCDVTDRAAVHSAARRAEAHFGPIDRLVANAGGPEPTRIDDFAAEHVSRVLALNLGGVANCIEAVLPQMLERGSGHLVATSSLAGVRGLPGTGAYSASKAAVTNLMESLRIDLRDRGVAVTIIAPGFVRTKPRKKNKKSNRPFRMDLEPATERIHAAILARKSYCAFPLSLVALIRFGRLLPDSLYDRLLAGRGPKAG